MQGASTEAILQWVSGAAVKMMRLHLCGYKCPDRLDAEDLSWMMNLVDEERGRAGGHPPEPPGEKSRAEERKRRIEKRKEAAAKRRAKEQRRREKEGWRLQEDL